MLLFFLQNFLTMNFLFVILSALESLTVCKDVATTAYSKSLVDSWAARGGYQEDSECCISGCYDGKDNLRHYLQCDIIWALATSAIPLPVAFLSGTLGDRNCLHSTSIARIRI